jgi:glutamate N-acetyltransferase/amino-acid N-acetyltransferase
MAVGEQALPELRPVAGIRAAAVAAGVRKPGRKDVVLFELAEGSGCAAVFTRNRFRAAPVRMAERHLTSGYEIRYLLVNTGNANAGTGAQGERDARACCEAVARETGCDPRQVLPFSTGVIGEPLPVTPIVASIGAARAGLGEQGWAAAASGILTTDTRPKGASEALVLGGRPVVITGIAKGAGMIRPDMATMLAFIGTDAGLEQGLARRALREAVAQSFNRITVDGDTSTNDACVLVSTGRSGVVIDDLGSAEYAEFVAALSRVCTALAQAIVRDGEGATRFVTVRVGAATTEAEAEAVAFTVAESPLVKTALYAGDPNWGRILAAVGRAGIADLDVDGVRVYLDDYLIAHDGGRASTYEEAEAARRMAGEEVTIRIELGRGKAAATVWTCDFSTEYVRINADYRS